MDELDLTDGYGSRRPAHAWHRGDRCLVRGTGQRGIVEGWKDNLLLVFWGSMNGQDYRSWVAEVECDWTPGPVGAKGG